MMKILHISKAQKWCQKMEEQMTNDELTLVIINKTDVRNDQSLNEEDKYLIKEFVKKSWKYGIEFAVLLRESPNETNPYFSKEKHEKALKKRKKQTNNFLFAK